MEGWNNLKFLQKSQAGEKEINLILIDILLTGPSVFPCPSCIPRKKIYFYFYSANDFFLEKEPFAYIFRIWVYADILQGNTFTLRLVTRCSRQPEVLASPDVEMFEAQTVLGSRLQMTHLWEERSEGLTHLQNVCQPQPLSDSKTFKVPPTVDKCWTKNTWTLGRCCISVAA